MKKRSSFFLVLFVLSLLISACGGPAENNGKVTIDWWHINGEEPLRTLWQQYADEYMATHPDVEIKISLIPENLQQKLVTQMQSGTPPDIFQSWGGGALQDYVEAGQVMDITSYLEQDGWGDSFNQAALSLYNVDGAYYGIPWDIGAVGFWYNKALFAQAGIDQLPTTWDEFLSVVSKLKEAGITPIALGEKDKWPGHFYWVYLAIRMGGQEAFEKAYGRTGSFSDPAFVQAGEKLQELIALEPFQSGFLGADYGAHQVQMGNGNAAMELMGQWGPNNNASSAVDKKGPELGFFPFPSVPDGIGRPTDVLGGGNGFAIGKDAPEEALDFVRFLTSAEHQREMAKQNALLPPVTTAADGVTNPHMQSVMELVNKAEYFQLYYDQALPPGLANAVLDSTQALFAKASSPEQVAQAIEQVAQEELQP